MLGTAQDGMGAQMPILELNPTLEISDIRMTSSQWLERLTVNAPVATVLGSIPASGGTVKSEGRQMKQC